MQHAIDVANDGEQVLIASGLYTQSATLYKPVSLTGVSATRPSSTPSQVNAC